MYFTDISDVIDALGEVLWLQYIVLQCRINRITSWMSLNCSEIQKCLEELGFKQCWNLFFGPPPFAKEVIPIVKWPLRSTIELCLDFSIISSKIVLLHHLPEERTDHVAVIWSWLLTLTQSWRNLSGLMSIQFRSRTGIEMEDSVTVSFWLWLCLRNRFPCNSVLNVFKRNGSWRSVTYLSLPFTIRTPRNCSVSKQRFNHDFDTVNVFWWRQTFASKTGPIFAFPRIHPSSSSSVMKNRPFYNNLQTGVVAQFGQFLVFRKLFEFFVHSLAAGSLQPLNLRIILCTNLPLQSCEESIQWFLHCRWSE